MKLPENDPIFIKLDELDDKDLYDEMLELINQIPRDKWNVDLLCTAASALNNLNCFDEVERLLNEEKDLCITNKDKTRWYYLLGYAYYGRNEVENAKDLALQALVWNPESEVSQELLLWIKKLCYLNRLDGTHTDNNFSWEFLLNVAFYDSYLIVKGTEDFISEKIQIFSELYPEGSNSYKFSFQMITGRKENESFMILACPNKVKTGDLLNFTLWFEENAFLVAFHRRKKTFSFVTTLNEYDRDALL